MLRFGSVLKPPGVLSILRLAPFWACFSLWGLLGILRFGSVLVYLVFFVSALFQSTGKPSVNYLVYYLVHLEYYLVDLLYLVFCISALLQSTGKASVNNLAYYLVYLVYVCMCSTWYTWFSSFLCFFSCTGKPSGIYLVYIVFFTLVLFVYGNSSEALFGILGILLGRLLGKLLDRLLGILDTLLGILGGLLGILCFLPFF